MSSNRRFDCSDQDGHTTSGGGGRAVKGDGTAAAAKAVRFVEEEGESSLSLCGCGDRVTHTRAAEDMYVYS